MNRKKLEEEINVRKAELNKLAKKKGSLQDKEVYKKSLELDKLVVKYMIRP